MAEAIFQRKVDEAGRSHEFELDSAGTGGWHEGELADMRTRRECEHRGTPCAIRGRKITDQDFHRFDHIICMDRGHVADLQAYRSFAPAKVSLMMDYAPQYGERDVFDPYYGGPDGFSTIYDMIDAACDGLMIHISKTG